jgi:hypothetical protein
MPTPLGSFSVLAVYGSEPFLIMLRSVSNPRSAEIVRGAIERHVGRRLARQLPQPGRQLRSDVVLSVIGGYCSCDGR